MNDERCPRCGGSAQVVPAVPLPLLICQRNPDHVAVAKVAKSDLPIQPTLRNVKPPKAQRPVRKIVVRGDD